MNQLLEAIENFDSSHKTTSLIRSAQQGIQLLPPPPHQRLVHTVARWPNYRPNNSKEASKNCPWPEKIRGRIMAEFGKKWQKRGQKIFFQLYR
jgi:hypothetical protein